MDEEIDAMSPQEHIWACALAIERQHGARSAIVVAERIGALALAGDQEGIAMWKAIAACLDELAKVQNGTQGHCIWLDHCPDRVILVRKMFSLAA